MKTENSTDKFFRKNLRNHSVRPSASAWEKLEQNLDEDEEMPKSTGFRKRKILFGVAVLLLVSGGIWYGSNFQAESEKAKIVLGDSLKNSSKNTNSKISQNITEGDSNHTKSTFEITTNQVVTSSKIKTENHPVHLVSELVQNQNRNTSYSTPKAKNTIEIIETKTTHYQKLDTENTIENLSLNNSDLGALESEKLETQKEHSKAPKKTQKVEIIIKMGSQGSNRQSPRNEKMKELFPEADSIEKVQKQKTRLGRVLKQVRNFKNGNKVDLNQLKKNPENRSSTQN